MAIVHPVFKGGGTFVAKILGLAHLRSVGLTFYFSGPLGHLGVPQPGQDLSARKTAFGWVGLKKKWVAMDNGETNNRTELATPAHVGVGALLLQQSGRAGGLDGVR